MKKVTMGMMIASKRKELSMTQLDLAEKMGVTDKAVSKWERDLSCPDVQSLPRLAEIFGMSLDELMSVKAEDIQQKSGKTIPKILSVIFPAVCLAMGVSVTVLSVLEQLDTNMAIRLLGIGVACGGISLIEKKRDML